MTVGEALRLASGWLAAAGIDAPSREARLLVRLVAGARASLDAAAPIDGERFNAVLRRRAAREPMAFIAGRAGFWTLDLAVSPATLIPRADSETLIEAALEARPDRTSVGSVLDLGCGTGALLLAALAEYPAAWGLGVDRAPAAASLAAANATANGLADRARFVCGDWARALRGRFDLVLSNPPYIRAGDIAGLMPEVAAHEPALALDGGADGLDAYRAIIPALDDLMSETGVAVLELGAGQATAVAALARHAGFPSPELRADLGGVARAMLLRRGAE